MSDDFVQRLTDQALLIRKMDELANASGAIQTNDATAVLLDKAAKVIRFYRTRYPDASTAREAALREALEPFAKAFGEVTMWAIPDLPFDEKSKGYAYTGLINSVSFDDFQRAAKALKSPAA